MNNILFKVLLLKGESGNSIASIAKTATSGLVDTYTVTLTDGSTTEFEVTNGKSIVGIAKTGTSGLVDTYTITFNDNTTATFTVTNGANGRGIASIVKTGTSGLVDTYTITYTDNTTSTFTVTNGADGTGDLTTDTKTGNPISLTTDAFQSAISTEITYDPIQAGSGDPSPSNIRTISGYDKIGLAVPRKNLFDKNKADGIFTAYFATTTIDASANTRTVSIPCLPNTTYTVSKTAGERFRVGFTKEKATVGVQVYGILQDNQATSISITTGNDAKCLVAHVFNSDYDSITADQMLASVQIELGSTATTYEPYNPATEVNINLGQTIYGGIWDVERGVLRVTHEMLQINDASLTWNKSTNEDTPFFYTNVPRKALKKTDAIFSCFAYDGNPVASMANNTFKGSDGYITIYVKATDYTDVNAFKTALGNQTFVYELATPIEIDLTPRIVNLLQGANVVISNGTSIEITYRNGNIATLGDVAQINKTINKLADLTEEQGEGVAKAVKQTDGKLDAKLNANETAVQALSTAQIRNIKAGDTDLTAGTSQLATGDIYIYYT